MELQRVTVTTGYSPLLRLTSENYQQTLKMVRDHFPTSHTDDPVTIADGLQPRYTTVHHDLKSTSTVYNLDCKTKQSKTKQQQQKCNKALGHS